MEAGHPKDAISEVKALISALPDVIGTCKKIAGDEESVVAWATILYDQGLKVTEKMVEDNFTKNYKAIMADFD